jgi:hypothetical protein
MFQGIEAGRSLALDGAGAAGFLRVSAVGGNLCGACHDLRFSTQVQATWRDFLVSHWQDDQKRLKDRVTDLQNSARVGFGGFLGVPDSPIFGELRASSRPFLQYFAASHEAICWFHGTCKFRFFHFTLFYKVPAYTTHLRTSLSS